MFAWKFKLLPPNTFSWDFDIALVKLNGSVPDAWEIAKLPAKEASVTDCKSAGRRYFMHRSSLNWYLEYVCFRNIPMIHSYDSNTLICSVRDAEKHHLE